MLRKQSIHEYMYTFVSFTEPNTLCLFSNLKMFLTQDPQKTLNKNPIYIPPATSQ